MNITVLDALTQTVYINKPFTSGIIRAALNDANGLALGGYNVTYVYYGEESSTQLFKTYSLGPNGLKDMINNNMKQSGMELNRQKELIINKLSNIKHDMIIIHIHSYSSYLIDICKVFNDIPKLFIVHDFIEDVYTAANMIRILLKIKSFNNVQVLSNSEFTKNYGNYIFKNRYDKIINLYPILNTIDINKENNFIDRGFNNFVYTNINEPIAYENKNYSINIGRYDIDKGGNRLLKLHNKTNDHLIKMYGTFDPYHDPNKNYYNRLKTISSKYPNTYQILEGLSDIELKNDVKYANNVIISCDHEGFGYTSYEMGLLGIPSIVYYKKRLNMHATSDYLNKIGVPFKQCDNVDELYDMIMNFKLSTLDKLNMSKQFIDYFSIDNFVTDRINAYNDAKRYVPLKKSKIIELF